MIVDYGGDPDERFVAAHVRVVEGDEVERHAEPLGELTQRRVVTDDRHDLAGNSSRCARPKRSIERWLSLLTRMTTFLGALSR